MHKGNISFKDIRKKVIQYNEDSQNIPINPIHKVSFRGIKRQQQIPKILIETSGKSQQYTSPIKLNTTRNKGQESNKKDCNKFSILLESKGFSNCNSAKKKGEELTFGTLSNINSSKFRVNTQRAQVQTERFDVATPKASKANDNQSKLRQIRTKNYQTVKIRSNELSSLSKLKSKLISPLKKKAESQPQPIRQPEKITNIFEHSSILSEHDLVNMSKTNQSIDFDMSPYL